MIRKSNIQWSVKTLVKMAKTNKISFDNAVQRGHCWDKARKSLLVHSVMLGYPIPAFYAAKINAESGSVYDMLDGKQRSNALVEFLSDTLILDDLPELEYETEDGSVETIDVSGLKFSSLPETLQDVVSDYSLTVYYFDGITEDEITELFWRLNNGKPLSAIELTRVKTKSKSAIAALAKHELFHTILTDSAINKFTHEEIILKAVAMIYCKNPSLDTKFIRNMTETMELSEQQVDEMNAVFDSMLNHIAALKERGNKKLLKTITTKTHFLTCCYIQHKANKDGTGQMLEWIERFFAGSTTGASINDQYNAACKAGSSKMENVDDRMVTASWDYTELQGE